MRPSDVVSELVEGPEGDEVAALRAAVAPHVVVRVSEGRCLERKAVLSVADALFALRENSEGLHFRCDDNLLGQLANNGRNMAWRGARQCGHFVANSIAV